MIKNNLIYLCAKCGLDVIDFDAHLLFCNMTYVLIVVKE